jgi:hypothetical protein
MKWSDVILTKGVLHSKKHPIHKGIGCLCPRSLKGFKW